MIGNEMHLWKNEHELYEYVGNFAIQFEHVCRSMEVCLKTILDVNGLHNLNIIEVLLSGYTAEPLRSLLQNLVGEVLVLSDADKKSCSKLFRRIQGLIKSRNEVLHSKWFPMIYRRGDTEESTLVAMGEKLRATKDGATESNRELHKPIIEGLLKECRELSMALALLTRCVLGVRTMEECFTIKNNSLVCNWGMLKPIEVE